MSTPTTNIDTMTAVLGYCRARRVACWVTYIRADLAHLPYPGSAAQLVGLHDNDTLAEIVHANGDHQLVPVAEVSMDIGD